jgi:hypothetical protein
MLARMAAKKGAKKRAPTDAVLKELRAFGLAYPGAHTKSPQWKIQGEWSNAAYNAGTGYPNSAGQNGCLGGS